MRKPKVTIGCRISEEWIEQIESVTTELGVSRSEWFAGLVAEALGKQDTGTVRSLSKRLTAVEQRLNKLAVLVMQ